MDLVKFYNSTRNGFTSRIVVPTAVRDAANLHEFLDCFNDTSACIINVTDTIVVPEGRTYRIPSNKVICGNGKVTFKDTLSIVDCTNVIIHNCIFDVSTVDRDCINIDSKTLILKYMLTDNIWIYHNKFIHTGDGAVDITGAKRVNVQGNHFCKIQKACLWGRSDAGTIDRPHDTNKLVTHTENYYESCDRRMPLLRGGFCHSYNNVITEFFAAGTQIGELGSILSEHNWYGGKCSFMKQSVASTDFDWFSMNYALGAEEDADATKQLQYWSRGDVETAWGKVNKAYLKDITADFIKLFSDNKVFNPQIRTMNNNLKDTIIKNAGIQPILRLA